MRNITILITLTFLTTPLFAGKIDKKLHKKCIYPTIMLFSSGSKMMGTGVVLKSVKQKDGSYLNLAATCSHILKMSPPEFESLSAPKEGEEHQKPKMTKPPRYEYKSRVGKYDDWSKLAGYTDYVCKVKAIDTDKDVALLTFVSKHKLHTAKLDFSPKLYISNEVYKIGCGMGDLFRLDYGRITSLSDSVGRLPNIKGTYRTSIPTIPGDSGGPVFHNYKLIGVTQAVRSIQTGPISHAPVCHLSYVIPLKRYQSSENIRKYLKSVDEFKNIIQEEKSKPVSLPIDF